MSILVLVGPNGVAAWDSFVGRHKHGMRCLNDGFTIIQQPETEAGKVAVLVSMRQHTVPITGAPTLAFTVDL